ncbi:metal-sulfur cluster assembly factor [Propionivibrio dicarboxylicus]|uniref:Metal-sulfur cluster biosynthetic enzyme n=1 Tax=Propionivibrio dicarboxylicus TaxID=83767 RepID=A0A1G8GPF0_9RHOO|nr:metal-sulfur cluster assembly factor [Propionivibrio dicarboxylicus]SDH96252.1 Metal-sulfur cluster biosynthetic enzyme [Propionivibrio dicarboxylicus]
MNENAKENSATGDETDRVRAALRQIIDPEVGVNIVDLGLVYDIVAAPERLRVDMTMTSPACPLGEMICEEARNAIAAAVDDGREIDIQLVWNPPWQPEMMSADAKQALGWN